MNSAVTNPVPSLKVGFNSLRTILLIFICKASLDFSTYYISGRVLHPYTLDLDLNSVKLFESYIFCFFFGVLIPKSHRSLFSFYVTVLATFCYLPVLSVFPLANEAREWFYPISIFWLTLLCLAQTKLPRAHLPSFSFSNAVNWLLLLTIFGFSLALVGILVGFSFNLDLSRVYEARTKFASSTSTFGVYFLNWSAFIAGPVLFVRFFYLRRHIFAGMIFLLQLLLFSATGHKTYLFSFAFVVGLIWLKKRNNYLELMLIGIASIILVGIFTYYFLDDIWITALFSNRMLILPALISFQYFEFFSDHLLVYLSHSVFNGFNSYPYVLEPSRMIAGIYYRDNSVYANTGFLGDAFMNFGFIGVFGIFFMLVIFLHLIENISAKKNQSLVLATTAMPIFFLVNGGFLTSLLTGGLGLALVLTYLLPNIKNENLGKVKSV